MTRLEKLRAGVDLPNGYSTSLSLKERKALIRRDLAKTRVLNAMNASKKADGRRQRNGLIAIPNPRKIRLDRVDSDRARVVRCIQKNSPITSFSISEMLNIPVKDVRYKITMLKRRGYLKIVGKSTAASNHRKMALYSITPAGLFYIRADAGE